MSGLLLWDLAGLVTRAGVAPPVGVAEEQMAHVQSTKPNDGAHTSPCCMNLCSQFAPDDHIMIESFMWTCSQTSGGDHHGTHFICSHALLGRTASTTFLHVPMGFLAIAMGVHLALFGHNANQNFAVQAQT